MSSPGSGDEQPLFKHDHGVEGGEVGLVDQDGFNALWATVAFLGVAADDIDYLLRQACLCSENRAGNRVACALACV
mgnify:CR=1 FL=1